MAITPLPTPPTREDPISFNDRADLFLPAIVTFAQEANQLAADINDDKVDTAASRDQAAASALEAAAARDSSFASSNFKGPWASLTGSLIKGSSVSHIGQLWLLLEDVANVTLYIPGTSAVWHVLDVVLPVINVNTPTHNATANTHLNLVRADKVDVILPPTPTEGDYVAITVSNGRYDNTLFRNFSTIEYLEEDSVLDEGNTTYTLCYLSNGTTLSWRFM